MPPAQNPLPLWRMGSVVLASFVSVSGCADSRTINAPKVPKTLKEQLAALEKSGALPALDRSTDVKGPDANNNGVRDDIDAWIAALPITDKQKRAAMQSARNLQRTLLVDLADQGALQRIGEGSSVAVACIADSFMPTYQNGYDLSLKIEALTANTKERALRYMQYNAARSGSVTSQPEGYTCD